MKREIWFALGVALALAAVPAPAQTPIRPPPGVPVQKQGNPLAITDDDRILGKPDAPITIVEYGSLTCPHCAAFAAEVLPKLAKDWIDTGKAKLVFRPFPRDDADLHAATVAACAPPDRFYPFIDGLFEAQQQWMAASNMKSALAKLALLGGMNKTTFDSCYDNKEVQDRLLQSRLVAAQQLGVDSTPTFYINGQKFDGAPTESAFQAMLSKAAGS
jgi:protein-disulfide isomerase